MTGRRSTVRRSDSDCHRTETLATSSETTGNEAFWQLFCFFRYAEYYFKLHYAISETGAVSLAKLCRQSTTYSRAL